MRPKHPQTAAEALWEQTEQAGWLVLLWTIGVVLFLTALCLSYVFRDFLARVSRVPPRRRPPLLTPPARD